MGTPFGTGTLEIYPAANSSSPPWRTRRETRLAATESPVSFRTNLPTNSQKQSVAKWSFFGRYLVAIAIILDLISQVLIFREIHPGAALLLGPVLIATPYSISRSLTNGIASRRTREGEANARPDAYEFSIFTVWLNLSSVIGSSLWPRGNESACQTP